MVYLDCLVILQHGDAGSAPYAARCLVRTLSCAADPFADVVVVLLSHVARVMEVADESSPQAGVKPIELNQI